MSEARPYIGGQAVLEGVMLRAPGCLSIAVRRPDGTLALREGPFSREKWIQKPVWKLPGFRGVGMLLESVAIGASALQFSAEQQVSEAERAEMQQSGGLATALSVLVALGLFLALPQGLASGANAVFGLGLDLQDSLFHLMTGGFKLLVLTVYLGVISRIPDVQRVFQYHGAEHKTIFAYESGLDLTVENVKAQSTLHPRCGTTFLIVVVFVSVVLGSIFTPMLLPNATGTIGNIETLALRIGLLPFIAAVSYELQRACAKYCTTGPLRILLWPGFLFQKITTREPTEAQVEVAITAMLAAIWRERVGPTTHTSDEPLVFADFAEFKRACETSLRPDLSAAA